MTVEFRLSPEGLGSGVDVGLRRFRDRWVAVADASGTRYVGIATSPRAALSAALAPLGRSAVAVLLADLGLLEPSCELLAQEASLASH